MNQVNFLLFLTATLLTAEGNDVVAFVVREHGFKVQILRLACMIPGHGQHLKLDLPLNQITLDVLVVGGAFLLAEETLSDLGWDQVASRVISLLAVIRDLDCGSRSEELVELHELEDFEDILELKEPSLWNRCKDNLDSMTITSLESRGMHDLVDALIAHDAHLSYKALIVLVDTYSQLASLAIAIIFELAHAELQAP